MNSLSVIIPFYKDFAFIEQAVHSVLMQRLDDCEVILVNDNPGDFSGQFLENCKFPDSVKIITHDQNKGLSAARNTGVSHASGSFIAYLDGDDYYLRGGLRKHLDSAIRYQCDFTHAATLVTYRDENGQSIKRLNQRDAQMFNTALPQVTLPQFPEMQFIVSSWKSIYRREHLQNNAIAFDETQRKFEDRLYVLDNVFSGASVSFIPDAPRVWRRRTGSITSSQKDDTDIKMMAALVKKCVDRVNTAVEQDNYDPIFLEREVFHAAWRIMWDSDLLNVAIGDSSAAATIRPVLSSALAKAQPRSGLFQDPVASAIDRTGLEGPSNLNVNSNQFIDIWTLIAEQRWEKLGATLREETSGKNRNKSSSKKRFALPKTRQGNLARDHGLTDIELILHIGMHKTGTTYLQQKFADNREYLLSQGVLFPETGFVETHDHSAKSGATPGHQGIVNAIVHDDRGLRNKLFREIKDSSCQKVLISCENLCFPYQVLGERLRRRNAANEFFAGLPNRRVVAVLRRPDEYFEAIYREKITNTNLSETRSARRFLATFGDSLLNYEEMLEPWAAFAGGGIQLHTYDSLRKSNNYLEEFCRLFDICDSPELSELSNNEKLYVTPDRQSIEFLRIINLLTKPGKKRLQIVSDFLQTSALNKQSPLSALSPDERIEIMKQFEQKSNSYLHGNQIDMDIPGAIASLEGEREAWVPLTGLDVSRAQSLFFENGDQGNIGQDAPQTFRRRLAALVYRQKNNPKYRSLLLGIYGVLPTNLKTLARGLYSRITQ